MTKRTAWIIDPPPEHLIRHKQVYEKHVRGETYAAIATELGVSTTRARQLAQRWARQIELHDFMCELFNSPKK